MLLQGPDGITLNRNTRTTTICHDTPQRWACHHLSEVPGHEVHTPHQPAAQQLHP